MSHAPRVAEQAAEGIRELNHATLRDGYTWPNEVAAVAGSLHALVGRLPQALSQAGDWLEASHRRGQVGVDSDLPADEAVRNVIHDIDQAIAGAYALAEWLNALHADAAHLTGI